jgi:hypothetical protein
MKWFGVGLIAVGSIGSILLWDVLLPVPVTVTTTQVGGPGPDIRQTEFAFSAALPMVFLLIVGTAILFLAGLRKSSR